MTAWMRGKTAPMVPDDTADLYVEISDRLSVHHRMFTEKLGRLIDRGMPLDAAAAWLLDERAWQPFLAQLEPSLSVEEVLAEAEAILRSSAG